MSDSARAEGLSARAAKGAAWIVGARLVMRLLGFVNTLVLARLLVPEDFGLVAVALTAMQLLQGVSDIGMAQAVIKFRDADRDDLDTLFTLSAARGAVIALLLFAAAPLAGSFYDDPRMTHVFIGAALVPLLNGLLNPRYYEFERDLDLSKEFLVSASAKLVGVTASIAIAVIWRNYWAVIAGLLGGAALQLVLSYALRPYRPRMTLASFQRVFGFSSWVAGVSVMAALNNKLDAFVLGRAIGPAGTGAYYVGLQLSELATTEIAAPIARALYPGLSALQGEFERMRSGYLKGVEALALFALPAAVGFSFVADDVIELLLGGKWRDSAFVIATLTPVAGVQTLFMATQFYAMALGKTRLVFFRELIFFLVRTPIFIWAAFEHGLVGAVIAVAGFGVFHVALNLAVYARAAGRPFFEPLLAARRSLAATALMAAWLFFLEVRLGEAAPIARLGVEICAGALIYAAALLGLWVAEGRPAGIERTALALVSRFSARA